MRSIDPPQSETAHGPTGEDAPTRGHVVEHDRRAIHVELVPRVLVVDDDMVALIVLKHMLETAGLDVTQAANVGAARGHLQSSHFDIIIADYLMPDATGLDLLDDAGRTPFVLLSGVIERGDSTDPRLADVTAHLTKPVSTEELRTVVMMHLPALLPHQ